MTAFKNRDAALSQYDGTIDTKTPDIEIGTSAFAPSRVLRQLEPATYYDGFESWLTDEGHSIKPEPDFTAGVVAEEIEAAL